MFSLLFFCAYVCLVVGTCFDVDLNKLQRAKADWSRVFVKAFRKLEGSPPRNKASFAPVVAQHLVSPEKIHGRFTCRFPFEESGAKRLALAEQLVGKP